MTQGEVQGVAVGHHNEIGTHRRLGHGRNAVGVVKDPHSAAERFGKQLGAGVDPGQAEG